MLQYPIAPKSMPQGRGGSVLAHRSHTPPQDAREGLRKRHGTYDDVSLPYPLQPALPAMAPLRWQCVRLECSSVRIICGHARRRQQSPSDEVTAYSRTRLMSTILLIDTNY